MFRRALGLLLLLLSLGLHAQNIIDARTATVLSYWETGNTKRYKLTRTKTGERQANTSVSIDLKVLASTDSTYDVEFKYHDMQLPGDALPDPRAAMAVEKMAHAVDGLRVVAKVDGNGGNVLEVMNAPEIKAHCDRILDGIVELSTDPEERAQMRAVFDKMITEDALTTSALEDISYFVLPFGLRYELGRSETLDAEFPNPLGGDPLPGTMDIGMKALDTKAGTARIHCSQRVDPAKLNAFIKTYLASLGHSGSASDMRELEKLLRGMKVDHDIDYDVDLDGAWIRKARSKQVVEVAGARQTDERVYELQ
ncbi:MAG TPA: hypothetical protein VGE21_07900 [Flavobacteriales bacterium]